MGNIRSSEKPSLSDRSVQSTDEKGQREKYRRRFAEMEFRALRAYLMNYKESELFDKGAFYTETAAFVSGAVGAGSGVLAIFFKETKLQVYRTRLGMLTPLALVFAMAMEYSVRGTSELFPSLAARAQRHVQAGAEMTQTYRLAKLYRSQLQAMPHGTVQWDEQSRRYVELLARYETSSKITVIRKKAYQTYNNTQLVCYENDKRKRRVDEYLDHEAKSNEDDGQVPDNEN